MKNKKFGNKLDKLGPRYIDEDLYSASFYKSFIDLKNKQNKLGTMGQFLTLTSKSKNNANHNSINLVGLKADKIYQFIRTMPLGNPDSLVISNKAIDCFSIYEKAYNSEADPQKWEVPYKVYSYIQLE